MDKSAPPQSKNDFKYRLRDWGIPVQHYKILEVIYLQSLMSHSKSGYKYNNDYIDKALHGSMQPETRYDRLLHYIALWEAKTDLEYGFETIHINEMVQTERLISEYKLAKGKIEELGKQVGLILDDATTDAWLTALQQKVRNAVSVNKREPGRYLTFDVNGAAKNDANKHEYFTRYIGLHYGVFCYYLDKIAASRNQKTAFFKFVSAKIQREHVELKTIEDFTPKEIQARIHNNKKIENYYEVPAGLRLLDEAFLAHLLRLSQRASITAA